MQEIEELIGAMAPSDANVLIAGESGVGKEVIATIHARSRRAEQPMVKLNCAAFPQTMIEGELFGYVKGAFTGAMHDFPGMIAAADGGTLFLDEISDMPLICRRGSCACCKSASIAAWQHADNESEFSRDRCD
jgi:Transcriptional regulator containing GAF, AAA-type ATPase, and DNA binding domains